MSERNERWLTRPADAAGLAGRAVRAGSWAGAAQAGRAVVELVATLVLARLLIPEEFGLVGMVVAITGFLVLFKDLGLSTATIQRAEITQEQVSALFLLNVGAGALLTALCALLAPVLAWFYKDPRLVDVTLVMSGTFLLGAIGVQHQALLRRQLAFGPVAAVELVAALAGVGAAVAAAMSGWSYWALVVRAVVSELVAGVGPWLACNWRPSRGRFDAGVKDLARFGGELTGFNVVNYFARNLDDVLVGWMFGPAALGLYQKAYELLMIPMRQFNTPVGAVAVPALSELDPRSERYRRAYLRILEKLLLVTTFVGALLIGTADWVIAIVLGPSWTEAAAIFAWLGLLVFTQPLGNTTSWLFITQDRTRDMLRWGVVGSTLAVMSFVAGLPWGGVGVAASYAVTGVLVRTPLLAWYVTRSGPVTLGDFGRTIAPFAVSGLAVVAAIAGLRQAVGFTSPVAGAAAAAVVALGVYAALMFAIPSCRTALADAVSLARMLRSSRKAA